MQNIIAVDSSERLVAKGCYHYYRNGEKMPVMEPWTVHRLPDGSVVTRSERDSRAYGNQILVHSVEASGQISFFEAQWNKFDGDKIQSVTAQYRMQGEAVVIVRTGVDGTSESSRQILPAACVISPLMRIYTGSVIQQLVKGGKSPVLVPWIRDPSNLSQLLRPLLSEREAIFQHEETVSLASGDFQANRYEYFGGEYQPGTLFWLDQHNVLLRYRWQQDEDTLWETNLEEYQR